MASGFQILDIAGVAISAATLFFAIFRMKSPKKKEIKENEDIK